MLLSAACFRSTTLLRTVLFYGLSDSIPRIEKNFTSCNEFFSFSKQLGKRKKHTELACFSSYCLFAEFLHISVNAALDDLQCNLTACNFLNASYLVLQLLVNLEEVGHFVEDMLRQLLNVLESVVGWVVEWDSDDLLIVLAAVYHADYTDWVAANQGQRINLLGSEKDRKSVV